MSKLIGTNPNQVPSNADLGTAAFMDKKDFLTSRGSSLSTINAVIPNTALNIFIYDTTKDSDAGAWRKRTQQTSWYNERLNTTTRGSRREFPAVAVIVAEVDTVTIYDADDPTLPMWMTWEQSGVLSWASGTTTTSIAITALNGKFVWGTDDRGSGIADFVKDDIEIFHGPTQYVLKDRKISSRAAPSFAISNGNGYSVIHPEVLDVAITVLPNAPIDSATGLPVPTIAIATDGGVSLIRDDRSVFDYVGTSQGSDGRVDKISFIGTSKILFSHRYASEVVDLISSDDSSSYYNSMDSFTGRITNSISHDDDIHVSALSSDNYIQSIPLNSEDAASKSVSGLSLANHYQVTSDPDRSKIRMAISFLNLTCQ